MDKKLNSKSVLFVLVFALSFVIVNCSNQVAGGASETENTGSLSGLMADSLGPLEDVIVTLIPFDFNPLLDSELFLQKDTSDMAGRYNFEKVPIGVYNLEVWGSDGEGAFVSEITVVKDSLTELLPLGLDKSGSVRVYHLELNVTDGNIFYFPGTHIYAVVKPLDVKNGFVTLDSVAPGAYSQLLLVEQSADTMGVDVLSQPVVVEAGENFILNPFSSWVGQKRWVFNTTGTGANLLGDVFDIPVLIRLHSGNFDFSLSNIGGEDLRFSKLDGTPLSYEMERWDAQNELAEFWVRVDTVWGNNGTQGIILYFGNPQGTGRSNPNAVFDTSNHFTGVYHLSEEAVGAGGLNVYRDATPNEFHGDDYLNSPLQNEWIGWGHYFDGVDDYIDLPSSINFIRDSNQTLTLSGWFRADSIESAQAIGGRHRLVDIHRSDTNGSSIAIALDDTDKIIFYNHATATSHVAPIPIVLDVWYHFALSYDGNAFRFYLNGQAVLGPVVEPLLAGGGYPVKIGKFGDVPRLPFLGALDEVRISKINRTADWIKWSYENQRSGSTAVTLEP